MMQQFVRPVIPVVVQQHAEESAMLRHIRSVLVRAPHVKLHHLRRLDDRIAAHLDGLSVAGAYGTECATAALARPGAGEVFAVAVRAIEERDDKALDRLIALAGALPDGKRGLLSAFGWVSAGQLQGIARTLLVSDDPLRREIGLAACRLHRTDPGAVLASALRDSRPPLMIAALRAAGELGRIDLLEHVMAAMTEEAEDVVFWAAWSACLLGERPASSKVLSALAQREGERAEQALLFLLQAQAFEPAREQLRAASKVADKPALKRRLIRGFGLLGDAQFLPWLIDLMADDHLARLAGESFSMITGADLAALDLERKPPEGFEAGPNDDPEDKNVAMDEDDSLPWPDRDRVQRWWQARSAQMHIDGRLFLGEPLTPERCLRALREGYQRQRIAAARELCLLKPGTPLFAVCAPVWRQQRALG